MPNIKELREQWANKITEARKYHEEHSEDWTSDREAQYSRIMADALDLKATLGRQERDQELSGYETEMSAPVEKGELPDPEETRRQDPRQKRAMVAMRQGYEYISSPASHRGEQAYRNNINRYIRGDISGQEFAALQSDNDTQAGYLVMSEQLAAGLLKAVDDLLYIRQNARIHTVREATSLGIRKRTAKASTFAWGPELATPTEDTTLAFGRKVLTPHYATGLMKVSRDLLRRGGDVEMIVTEEMAIDAAELLEDAYLTGNGSQQPLGVFTASSDGISTSRDVSTGNTSSAITATGLYEAAYALKSQYRKPTGSRSGARWLFSRTALKQIALLKDGDGQYLWHDGLRGMEPERLLGFPVDESERCPATFTTGQYVGILANWRYYEIADALDMEMQRLVELYAATNQVGFMARLKTDGMPTLEEAFVRVKLG